MRELCCLLAGPMSMGIYECELCCLLAGPAGVYDGTCLQAHGHCARLCSGILLAQILRVHAA